jgi:hypothetical protein
MESTKQPLDIVEPDDCCAAALSKALRSGNLKDETTWQHAKCGCKWKAHETFDGMRHWKPVTEVWIF